MESLLNRLYDALGLDAPEDEPLLIIDDGIQVYFNESDHTLEMCCPFMPLPDDILTLQHFLRLNYTSAVTIGRLNYTSAVTKSLSALTQTILL
ncbi:invasion protein E [Salmonella enterica subsp. enterica serovar Urbana str. R8-2977]|uniref:Invasion protein E n=1 Tax=Salmonella enterica subsp. enterica serovar Urbana str. R8-2977 TaxID=913084 RepID=G5RTH5_SALET|nr:invasion protein E [Salmonella enterica subsp. enterica serovar Urbana str. R8-2977]